MSFESASSNKRFIGYAVICNATQQATNCSFFGEGEGSKIIAEITVSYARCIKLSQECLPGIDLMKIQQYNADRNVECMSQV